jgi:hypothetical protein
VTILPVRMSGQRVTNDLGAYADLDYMPTVLGDLMRSCSAGNRVRGHL